MPSVPKAPSTPKLFFSRFGGEQPIPPEFIAAMERIEERQAVPNGTAPEDLSDTVVESRIETDRKNEVVRTTIKKKEGNITLSAIRTNDQGQPVQVERTLYPTGTAPTETAPTTTVAVQDLGNGWSIEEVATEGTYIEGVFTPGIFGANLYRADRPSPVPQKFLYGSPATTVRLDTEGTAAAPTLGGDETSSTQEQIADGKVRTTVETQPTTAVSLSGKGYTTEYGGGGTNIEENLLDTIATTPSGSLTLISHRIEPVGDGSYIEQKEELTAGAWPELQGQEFDRATGAVIQYTKQIVAEGSDLGTAACDIDPLDENKAWKKVYELPTLQLVGDGEEDLGIYFTCPVLIDVALPNVLESLSIIYSEAGGTGSYTETGDGVSVGDTVSLTLGFSGRGQGSAAVMPDLIPVVTSGDRRDVPAIEVWFYLETNPSHGDVADKLSGIIGATVLPWPKFRPTPHTILLKGQRAALSGQASVQQHYNGGGATATYTFSEGTGTSQDIDLNNRIIQLPETIHAEITLSGSTTENAIAEARATATIPGGSNWPGRLADTGPLSKTVTASVSTGVLPATPGEPTIPVSGKYYRGLQIQPFPEGGCVKARAIVVDFADL